MGGAHIVPNGPVGGSGGKNFHETKWTTGITLQKLGFWKDSDCLHCIELKWSNGSSVRHGKEIGDYKSISFSPGEKCTELILWGNGRGTRAGRIQIHTDAGQSYDWGKDVSGQNAYPLNVGSGLLVGFGGASATDDIYRLVPLFLEQLKSVEATIEFGQLPSGMDGISNLSLDSADFDGNHQAHFTFGNSMSKSITQEFIQSATSSFGLSLKITAGIPEVASTEAGASWDWSNTSTHESSNSSTTTLSWGLEGDMEPGEKVHCQAYCWEGHASINYTSKITVTFNDGSTQGFSENGTYNGVDYSTAYATDTYS
ncbi:unnamed protein product [Penicillium nalgiovense]|nr:unnamed protein product [Penicillium nalgiovense]